MNPSVAFLFRAGRKARHLSPEPTPSEFLYGFPEMKEDGGAVYLIEDSEVGLAPPLALLAEIVNKLARVFARIPVGMVVPLFRSSARRRLNAPDIIIATTNGFGFALGLGKRFGLIRSQVLLLAMGLLPHKHSLYQKTLIGWATSKLDIATISKEEQGFLEGIFPSRSIHYVTFGVDTQFWHPANGPTTKNYVLSIGNDLNRDWDTLIEAWRPDYPNLKIITKHKIETSQDNIKVIAGDWRSQTLSDADIRSLYHGARCVVVPCKPTIQPAGQSVCLQAMACGKAVVMADIAGLWDRAKLKDGESVLLVHPEDVSSYRSAIERLLDDSALAAKLEVKAREVVEEHFSSRCMANDLTALINKLHRSGS